MNDRINQHCATDKEIFDILMSSKKKLTDRVLLDIARSRGIFYSPKASREDLAAAIAVLPHDFPEITKLIERGENSVRSEKTTSVRLNSDVSMDDIKDALELYKEDDLGSLEDLVYRRSGIGTNSRISIKLDYVDVDYSKTRLIQRQKRESNIEVLKSGSETIIRMPANQKSKDLVANIVNRVGSRKKSMIEVKGIELKDLRTPESRTEFFLELFSSMQAYQVVTVTNLKVASFRSSINTDTEIDIDEDDDNKDKSNQMLYLVKSIAMNGNNLMSSNEYQDLRKKGFYIYGIRWQADQQLEPYHRVQFDVAFDDAKNCTEFKYGVSYSHRLKKGKKGQEVVYSSNFRPPTETDKSSLFQLIEETARRVLVDLHVKKYQITDDKQDSKVAA